MDEVKKNFCDFDFSERNQHNKRSVITEAAAILYELSVIYENIFGYKDCHEKFYDSFFGPMLEDNNLSGEKMASDIDKTESMTHFKGDKLDPEDKAMIKAMAILATSCAFIAQAIKSPGNDEAWAYIVESGYYYGLLTGILVGIGMDIGTKKQIKLANDARHAENRAMKSQIMEWCSANMSNFNSMDSAAEAIAGKVVPVKFRTVRSWIGEWNKIQSTRKL